MTNTTALACRDSGGIDAGTMDRHAEDAVIEQALAILQRRTCRAALTRIDTPREVNRLLMLAYGQAERESFGVLWMDVKHRVVKREELFTGTLAHCSVYPREIVKEGLLANAAGCILFHNHPGGENTPSQPDLLLTKNIRDALALVDIQLHDHVIVAGATTYSFAAHGHL